MIPKTEGIVLRSFDFRETSRIVTFFTKDYGKITGVLKGIRKDPKKFGSNIDNFSVNDIVYYHYRKSDLHLISQCDLKEFFFAVRRDYRRNVAANYMLELINAIMPPEQTNEDIYQLAKDFLDALEATKDIDKLIFILQIKVLQMSGFNPHLDSCVVTGKKIKGRARFSSALGGLVSPDCPTQNSGFRIISQGTISYILHIQKNSWNKSMLLGLTNVARKELKLILDNFLTYHLDKKLKSNQYLH